jgi:hypothetical protein
MSRASGGRRLLTDPCASLSFESPFHLVEQSRRVSHDQFHHAMRVLQQFHGLLVTFGFHVLRASI